MDVLGFDPFTLPSVKLEDRTKLPKESGVYFFVRYRAVLYIGQAVDIRGRCCSHDILSTVDGINNIKIAYKTLQLKDLDDIEALAIDLFQPPLNIKGTLFGDRSKRSTTRSLETIEQWLKSFESRAIQLSSNEIDARKKEVLLKKALLLSKIQLLTERVEKDLSLFLQSIRGCSSTLGAYRDALESALENSHDWSHQDSIKLPIPNPDAVVNTVSELYELEAVIKVFSCHTNIKEKVKQSERISYLQSLATATGTLEALLMIEGYDPTEIEQWSNAVCRFASDTMPSVQATIDTKRFSKEELTIAKQILELKQLELKRLENGKDE